MAGRPHCLLKNDQFFAILWLFTRAVYLASIAGIQVGPRRINLRNVYDARVPTLVPQNT